SVKPSLPDLHWPLTVNRPQVRWACIRMILEFLRPWSCGQAASRKAAAAHLDEGTAELHVRNGCSVLDTFTVENSLTPTRALGNPVSAVIDTLDIEWGGVTRSVVGPYSTPAFMASQIEVMAKRHASFVAGSKLPSNA